MNINQLHNLIERYFDADTSIDEERRLKHELTHTHHSSTLIDEARAVMGYSVSKSPAKDSPAIKPYKQKRLLAAVSIAASIAIVAIAVTTAFSHLNPAPADVTESYAFVDGTKITDDNTIAEMMAAHLNIIADASDNVTNNTKTNMSTILSIQNFVNSNL